MIILDRKVLKKIFLSLSIAVLTVTAALAQKKAPQDTEVWEPEPPVVTPGTHCTPPSDAVVLFDGQDLSQWENTKGEAAAWTVHEGIVTCKPRTGAIRTKQGFGDCQLHLEWKTPVDTAGLKGQARGNSGVFLQGKYEVQVLDSYKNRTYSNGQAASIYKQHIPLVNASRPPGEWQSYDIFYTAPRFNDNGTLKSPAYITVLHNGILVQHHSEVKGPTVYIGDPKYEAHEDKLPLSLQDHGNHISYRNIWIREL